MNTCNFIGIRMKKADWKRVPPYFRKAYPDAVTVFEHFKGTCYRLIAARVSAGEVSLI